MKINNNISIVRSKNNIIKMEINGTKITIDPNDSIYSKVNGFYEEIRGYYDKETAYNNALGAERFEEVKSLIETACNETAEAIESTMTDEEKVKCGIEKLMAFFSEFSFEPNFRFLNTLSRYKKENEAKDYITNYFELINSPYANQVNEKLKSKEFKECYKLFKTIATEKTVNDRFKIYYGSQGTGKTTKALDESNGKCIVCHSAMLPSDLIEDFKFADNGNAEFIPSVLCKAMENGDVIVLDEINLLPFESLRFLQGVLDGKKSFSYKDRVININDGFMIIGTMNLTVNGMTYGLPEPLVDRCADTKKFVLTAENLMSAII